jgi:nicotinamidase-related amidase
MTTHGHASVFVKTRDGRTIPTTVAEICDPRISALIVYDMQVGVVGQIAGGETITSSVGRLLEAARASGMAVYFTRHCWLPDRYAGVAQQRRAMIWQHKADPADTCVPFEVGSAPWEIVPELSPRRDEVVIDKITMSCFAGTFIDMAMRDAGLTSFLIAGIALEIGIEPSVRHALDLNYIPLVVTDACGSGDSGAYRRSLETLSFTGEVLTAEVNEVVKSLRPME